MTEVPLSLLEIPRPYYGQATLLQDDGVILDDLTGFRVGRDRARRLVLFVFATGSTIVAWEELIQQGWKPPQYPDFQNKILVSVIRFASPHKRIIYIGEQYKLEYLSKGGREHLFGVSSSQPFKMRLNANISNETLMKRLRETTT